jgi:hypothetical protein
VGTGTFRFQPIAVNANAPKGACILRTFDDISAFILTNVEQQRGLTPHWIAVRRDLLQARYGARRDEVHEAMRNALIGRGLAGRRGFRLGARRSTSATQDPATALSA